MKKNSPEYEDALYEATTSLFDEFLRWNEIQRELKDKGYPNNHYDDGEVLRERSVFRAIAERFVLEDIDCSEWEWFETPWVGTDGNTGFEACLVDFVMQGPSEPELGILSFYVTRNAHFWYAIPLAEMPSDEEGLTLCQTNCIHDAVEALKRGCERVLSLEVGNPHDAYQSLNWSSIFSVNTALANQGAFGEGHTWS